GGLEVVLEQPLKLGEGDAFGAGFDHVAQDLVGDGVAGASPEQVLGGGGAVGDYGLGGDEVLDPDLLGAVENGVEEGQAQNHRFPTSGEMLHRSATCGARGGAQLEQVVEGGLVHPHQATACAGLEAAPEQAGVRLNEGPKEVGARELLVLPHDGPRKVGSDEQG